MRLSIIIPTYNNFEYLKFFLSSLKKNSKFKHEIILHINDGSDGTLNYALKNKIKHSHSYKNIGLCSSMNKAFSLTSSNHILYSHDDMYFCKNWDDYLIKEIANFKHNLYYLTGVNVSTRHGLINFDCGSGINNFDKKKFDTFCLNDKTKNLQGSHWSPNVVHRKLWEKIGGFSEEFNPGDASDPDFCMKLWLKNVRVFKGISKFKVYHFNSLTTRSDKIKLNNGTKQFLLKYGFTPRFFRKYYLRGDISIIPYIGKLSDPIKTFFYFYDIFKCKLKLFYNIFINN